MIAPDICDEGSIFMEFRTIEQTAQLKTLDDFFEVRNPYLLSEFFRKQNIWDDGLLADKECYTFFRRSMPITLKVCLSILPVSMYRR